MQGFKSFAKKTEVVFDEGINVIIGPNGAGKSNVSDALCFALGRLSIKSMRAAKASNLIFMGSKYVKPAGEASVELIFDNSDRAFNLQTEEVVLKRAVRRNGQGIYKINGETKTRGEIIELLAHAGIDPHGFNMVLQGQIQSIVKIHPEERRKIIEEVAGISIYESRKEKSLRELEKTEVRLKEIGTILRERTAYLNNLEKEKKQAERYKELETTVKRAKASILHRKSKEKEREIEGIIKSIETRSLDREKLKSKAEQIQGKLNSISERINNINKEIQQATGFEQETLHNDISNLRAELEGLRVRKENYENRRDESERRIEELEKTLPELEKETGELKKESPLIAKKSENLKKKKSELAEIEQERKNLLKTKSELESLKLRIKDKEIQYGKVQAEIEQSVRGIEEYSRELEHKSEEDCKKEIEKLSREIVECESEIKELNNKELEFERKLSVSEVEIKRAEEDRKNVSQIKICPLCHSNLTEEHKDHVFKDSDTRIEKYSKQMEECEKGIEKIKKELESLRRNEKDIESNIRATGVEFEKHKSLKDKKNKLRLEIEEEREIKQDIEILEAKRKSLEEKTVDLRKVEENYESKILEIEEISGRTEEDVNTALLYKEREIENTKNIVKRSRIDLGEFQEQIDEINNNIQTKDDKLENLEEKEQDLNKRFKEMFSERDKLQRDIQEGNLNLSEKQGEVRQVEDQINYLKIGKAKLDAEHEALQMEIRDFAGVEILSIPFNSLEDKLRKSQEALQSIGSINMRALEVYDQVKEEYDKIYVKVETLEKEKAEIMKIIEEIDKKKKHTFMKTFRAINELFTENFGRLTSKGVAYLELENKEDIFAGGANIVVKLAKGKYFDVTSLSGGEQTLVALSLLFAIQEYKPYHFYIFDEIDAALDKRNSERLAGLLKQYMKKGQYIVVTHNDAIILESNLLYGVSMHEGVSKILSLKV